MTTESRIAFASGVFALVALAVAVATAAVAFVVVHHNRRQIHTLQRELAVLCARRVVTGVESKSLTRITVRSATGC